MGLFDQKSAVEAMEDLLERERQAILEGRFDVLDRLVVQKESQVKALRPKAIDKAALDRLRKLGERNARLLDAMRQGIEAVQQRLAALQGPGAALQTYGSDGQRNTHMAARKTETRRV